MSKINCKLKRNKGSTKCERKWEQTNSSAVLTVYKNPRINRRAVMRKGKHGWIAWQEKNEGRLASDKSHIKDGYLGALLTKKEAEKKINTYMRKHK